MLPRSFRFLFVFGSITHRQLQRSILFESGLLKKVMASLRIGEKDNASLSAQQNIGIYEHIHGDEDARLLSGARCPLLGHLIQIAQVSEGDLFLPVCHAVWRTIISHLQPFNSH